MDTGTQPLHVVFNRSAAVSLRQALAEAGRPATVLALSDDLSIGPIGDLTPAIRATEVQRLLGVDGWGEVTTDTPLLVEASLAAPAPPVAWFSPDSAAGVAFLLWWISAMGDRPALVNEVPSMGIRPPNLLMAHLEGMVPLSPDRRAAYRSQWRHLVAENAPLRTLRDARLVSAPVEHYDAALLRNVASQWRKFGYVVGLTLTDLVDTTNAYQTSDLFLASRIRHLARAGAVAWQGDLDVMRHCEIRLPT